MGYGPSDHNRHGWCWRNDHGNGIRMSPYFATEADCNEFHDFFHKNYQNYQVPEEYEQLMLLMMSMRRPDLRTYKLREVNKMAKDFHNANPTLIAPIHAPVGETLWEFFKYDVNPYYDVPKEPELSESEDENDEELVQDKPSNDDDDEVISEQAKRPKVDSS